MYIREKNYRQVNGAINQAFDDKNIKQRVNLEGLSVIIVAYKSQKVISDCLKSIKNYNDLENNLEVIVVDNSPRENSTTYDHINQNFPWVKLIQNNNNDGFGQANNIGAQNSSGKYLLFLNPDTILVEPIFKYAVDRFEKDQELGAFGMILSSDKGRYSNSYGIMPERKKIWPSILYLPIIKYLNYTPQNIYPYGADLFIRRDLFFKAGGFDENIFLCYEEPDLIRRLDRVKVKIFNKSIIHLEGHTTEDKEERISKYLDSEKYYFTKHGLNYKKYIRYVIISLSVKRAICRMLKKTFRYEDNYLLDYYKKIYEG